MMNVEEGVPPPQISPANSGEGGQQHNGAGLQQQNSEEDADDGAYGSYLYGVAQQSSQGAVRFPVWVALAILSALAWIAMLSRKHLDSGSYKYSISVATLTTVFSILSVVGYIFYRGIYMTQPPELACAGIVMLLWATGLPVIMNPSHAIAVSYTQVENANLYFASWLSFFCVLWICFNLGKEVYGMDIISDYARPIAKSKQGHWYALVAASLVVTSASVRVFKADDCSIAAMKNAPICKQTKFAISAGVIATLVSTAVTILMARGRALPMQYEFLSSIVMFVIWCFGMGFITFGEGPGHAIGNLYFATWACFVLSILICSECYRERLGQQEQSNQAAADAATSDLQLEEIPPGEEDGIDNVDPNSKFTSEEL